MNLNIRERGNLLQVCIPTGGCRLGKCIFCNYGKSQLPDINELEIELNNIFNKYKEKEVILLNAMGSILDKDEVPFKYVEIICKLIQKYSFPNIVFETHYTTITEDICIKLTNLLPDRSLYIELGLESVNKNSLDSIHKKIDFKVLQDKITILKKYHIQLEGNVFLGIPFLSKEQRIQDSVDTICYALQNGFNEVVLFPCNLRLGTALYDLYLQNKYEPVSHLEVLTCLRRLPSNYLNRVSISWYGDWNQFDNNGNVVNMHPLVSDKDISIQKMNKLSKLYQSFYNEYLISDKREEVVSSYLKEVSICLKK